MDGHKDGGILLTTRGGTGVFIAGRVFIQINSDIYGTHALKKKVRNPTAGKYFFFLSKCQNGCRHVFGKKKFLLISISDSVVCKFPKLITHENLL